MYKEMDLVPQCEADVTPAWGCCRLVGRSGFSLGSDEGVVASELDEEQKEKEKITSTAIESKHVCMLL